MSEDIQIPNTEKKNYNLSSFFSNNIKSIIAIVIVILFSLFVFFFYLDYKKNKKIEVSELYNLAVSNYKQENPNISILELKNVINIKDKTYSPLALYFLLDNNLITDRNEINQYFDILIEDVDLDKEIKNLIIYKKGLFNSNFETENNLINILNPIIKSDSVWKSHALYLLAEYFFDKNQKEKAKEFYNQILNSENSNENILKEAQKRLSRDLSE